MRMRERHRFHLSQLFVIISALIFGTVVLGIAAGYRLNVSRSVDLGLYRLHGVPIVLSRGQLVVIPLPDSVRAWHSPSLPIIKTISGLAGDTVCVTTDGLWVEGQYYGAILGDAAGQALPHPLGDGCTVVPNGYVFLASTVERSLDGRYMGFTNVEDLTTTATPVWTWKELP